MQATYQDGTVGLWEDFGPEPMQALLNDPFVKHVKVRKMTPEVMAGKNKAIQKRRTANKAARKARRR